MRGFLSSVLGGALVLLFISLYGVWLSTSDLYSVVPTYMKLLDDVYVRSDLERSIYVNVRESLGLCIAGELSPSECTALSNARLILLLERWRGIVEKLSYCPEPIVYVPDPGPALRFVCTVRGRVGYAEIDIPAGVEVKV